MISSFLVGLAIFTLFIMMVSGTYALFVKVVKDYNEGHEDTFDILFNVFLLCMLILLDIMILAGMFKLVGW